MKLRALSCNKILLKKNLTRFWPAMLIIGLLLALVVVMPMFGIASMQVFDPYEASFFYDMQASILTAIMPFINLVYAGIVAACVFGYLHKAKSCYMLHAFPITRETLFATSLLSGALLFLIPFAAVCLLAFLLPLIGGLFLPKLLLVYGYIILQFLIFYFVAVLCMHLSGKRSFALIFYFLLNVIAPMVEAMLYFVIEEYLVGIRTLTFETSMLLSPICYFYSIDYDFDRNCIPWLYSSVWLLVGIGLCVCALLLYRRRRLETVGQSVCFDGMTGAAQYVLTLLSALYVGGLFYLASSLTSQIAKIVLILLAGLIAYFLLEIPMRRTRKIFRWQTLLRYGAFAGTFVAFVLFFRFDVLNIVGYVPQPQEVASITFENYIEGCELTVSDPEMIEGFCALHELIVDSRDSAIDPEYGYVREQVSITYTLKNGDSVERYYVFSKKQPVVFEQALEFFSSPAFNELFLDFLEERTLSISDSRLDNLSEEMDGIFEALRNDIQTPQALYLNPAKNDAVRLELSYRVGTMVSSMIIYLPNTAEHTYSYLEQIS